jgi:hypothetical protein
MKDVKESKDIKNIITRINKLQKKEKMHILNILKINDINFTKNENGYFFNLLTIDNYIVDKISKCLELIEKNSDIIKEIDKKRSELITYYKILIEERLQNTLTKRKLEYIETLIVKKISNINYNINIIYKIKRKNIDYEIDDNILQADALVKQFLKNVFKFKKDSVYSRIHSCIKTMQNKRSKSCVIDSNDTITEVDNNFETGDLDISLGECNELLEDDIEDIENIENIEDDIDDILEDNTLEYDIEEVQLNKKKRIKEEYDDSDDEDDKLNIIEEQEDYEKEEKRKDEEDISYYRELLHLKGFSFDDNKQCMLLYQEYIY